MQFFNKLLVTSGLVIVTGPLCFTAQAQDYIDLEAERAAAEAAGRVPVQAMPDPYGARPAQTYPATRYGTSGVPPAPAATVGSAPAPIGGAAPGQNLGKLFYQVQQLQQEVMLLNGKIEEQAHELQQLKEQSRQRYVDLDKRLSGAAAESPAMGNVTTTAVASPPTSSKQPAATPTSGVEQAGESEAYQAAYGLVVGRQFEQAVPAFRQFLSNYPEGKFAPNAQYWLGELYLVMDPPDLESARQAFALLISQYPDNSKAPDALFKLGKVQFMKGNREKAREYLDLVISQYSASNSAAVKLARNFIAENY